MYLGGMEFAIPERRNLRVAILGTGGIRLEGPGRKGAFFHGSPAIFRGKEIHGNVAWDHRLSG